MSIEDIISRNFNLDISNPYIGEQIEDDPNELLSKYKQQVNKIQNLRNQLKAILEEALKEE